MSGTKKAPKKGAAPAKGPKGQGQQTRGAGAPPSRKEAARERAAAPQAGVEAPAASPSEMPRLQRKYLDEVRAKLAEEFGYKNPMQVPRLEKIVLNMGVGEATQDKKKVETAAGEMELIAGQKPVITKAKKSIATFKLREGMPIGVKVTLRRERMYEFLDRFITIALPRVRDFRGLNPKSFDGRGNYACGLKEQLVFPEINYDRIDKVRGMDVIVTTTAKTDDEARELLRLFGFPFPIEAEDTGAEKKAA